MKSDLQAQRAILARQDPKDLKEKRAQQDLKVKSGLQAQRAQGKLAQQDLKVKSGLQAQRVKSGLRGLER